MSESIFGGLFFAKRNQSNSRRSLRELTFSMRTTILSVIIVPLLVPTQTSPSVISKDVAALFSEKLNRSITTKLIKICKMKNR